MPCDFHKLDGRICQECRDYSPIKEKILIIKLDAPGDVLRTTSILPATKKKYPYCHITWLTKKEAVPLLQNNNFIDMILNSDSNYLEFILSHGYDISFCLDAEPLSSAINTLCKARIKKGFIADKNGRVIPAGKETSEWYWLSMNDKLKKSNRKTYFEHIYNICGLNPPYFKPQYNLSKEQLEFAKQFKLNKKLQSFEKIVGINTGAGCRWQLKKWILKHYIEIIRLIKAAYPRIGVLLYGGKIEKEFNKEIINNTENLVIDTGCDNSLEEFAALVSACDIFLTPDTLGMQLSIALDKTTLVLAGPTSPWELDIFNKGQIIYNHELDCIGCYLSSCSKNMNCMNTIIPEGVFKILEKYIKNESSNN
jgi:heptosyltransferase-2